MVPQLGAQVNVLIFIVIMIGGLGSTVGCLIGALLVGLMANYTGFLMPKAALFSNIALMVAILLCARKASTRRQPLGPASCPYVCFPAILRAAWCWARC